eukprot:TRINITY_DN607_c0_g1_i3.p1 TRINITY_DN607_c0_g1~~TRINITY_DN607_c0_g1_i3.p1  ORF type:complete len:198 (-),score=61.95 TRINITY_DN607_c0_g1_i3:37-630(-)
MDAAKRRISMVRDHLDVNQHLSSFEVEPTSNSLREFLHSKRPKVNTAKPIQATDLKSFVGKEIALGDYFEVTQERVDLFADATGDFQWIHVNPERAKAESPFGGPIAHGFLTLSLLPFLLEECMPNIEGTKFGVNYGFNKVRFVAPVHVGSKVRVRVGVHEVTEISGGLQLVLNINIEKEGDKKPAVSAEWIVRHYF